MIKNQIVSKYRSIEVTNDNITLKVPDDLLLSDNVLILNHKGNWVVIPISTIVKYPIIYFYDEKLKETGSVVCCLLTLRCMYVYEKVRWIGYNGLEASFNNEAGESMSFETKLDKNGEKLVEFKRSQIKIQSLRSSLIDYGDLFYLNLNLDSNFKNKSNLIPLAYYSNLYDYQNNSLQMNKIDKIDFHPKTLCTLIQYQSSNNSIKTNIKTTIIISKDSTNKNADGGYEPRKGKIDEYLASSSEKLIEKKAFIMQILLYTSQLLYDNVKVIILK
jgi:hypothetical protein